MSGLRYPNEGSDVPVVAQSPGMQSAANKAIYAQWQQGRLIEARGILADIAHHPDSLIVLACQVICTHGPDPVECADALGVSWLLGSRLSETSNTALNGGAT